MTVHAHGDNDFVIIQENNKKGLATIEGKVLIPPTYEDIGWSQGILDISHEVIGYKQNESWGLITIHNKVITPALYSELFKANDQVIIAAKKGQFSQKNFFGLLDHQGKNLSGFQFTNLAGAGNRIIGIYRDGANYYYGVLGVLNNMSNVVIPFSYKKIEKISESLFRVKNEANRYAIFSADGNNLTGFTIDRTENKDGYLYITSLGKSGLMTLKGEIIFAPEYAEIFIDKNQPKALAISSWSILDKNGKIQRNFQVENMSPYSDAYWKISGNGYEGIMDLNGKMLTNHEINRIGKLQDDVSIIECSGKFGLIRSNGKIIIPARFDSLIYADGFIYTRFKENQEMGWAVMDTFAVTKSKILYDDIRLYQEKLFAVKKKGKWGFIDRTGEEIVACVYDEVGIPKNNLVEIKFHGEYGIITLDNEWVVLPKKYKVELVGDSTYILKNPYQNSLHNFRGEMIYFTNYILKNESGYLSENIGDSTIWFIDLGGRMVDQTSPMTTVSYDDGNITIVRRNSKLGAMDHNGKIIIDFNNDFEDLHSPSEGYFGIKKNGNYGFIDFDNRLRIANRYENVKPFCNNLAAVKIRNKWGFIDKKEQLVIQPFYDEVESFNQVVSIVKKDGKSGILKIDGELEQPLEFDEIKRLPNGKYLIIKDEKFGMLNENGRQIITPKFDEIHDTDTDYLIVRNGGKYGIIALNGVPLIPPTYDELIYDKAKGVYLAKIRGQWAMK